MRTVSLCLLVLLAVVSSQEAALPAATATAASGPAAAASGPAAPPAGPAPAPKTEKEIECLENAAVRCHHDFRERCPATKRGKHCCRHWYSYLGFCYAWSLDWCWGPPKKPGVPCEELPKAPAAAPTDEDAEDDAASGPADAASGPAGGEAAEEAF